MYDSSGNYVTGNDDSNCGRGSQFTYSLPASDVSGCLWYSLKQGCYSTNLCSGTSAITSNSGIIYYGSISTYPSFVPSLSPSLVPTFGPTTAPTVYLYPVMQGRWYDNIIYLFFPTIMQQDVHHQHKHLIALYYLNTLATLGIALCALAASTAPNTKGQSGWTCASDNATPLTSVCLWAGVLCDGGGRVTDVLLGGLLLTGTIPSRIGLATSLTHLDLTVNNLYGALPSSLGSLVNLQYLDISQNSISRSIPNTIVNLQSLSYLVLSGNKLTGTVPSGLCTITSLNTLYVDNNPLTCYWNCMSTVANHNFGTVSSLCTPGNVELDLIVLSSF